MQAIVKYKQGRLTSQLLLLYFKVGAFFDVEPKTE